MIYKIQAICYCIVFIGILFQIYRAYIENKKKNTTQAIYELLLALVYIILIK